MYALIILQSKKTIFFYVDLINKFMINRSLLTITLICSTLCTHIYAATNHQQLCLNEDSLINASTKLQHCIKAYELLRTSNSSEKLVQLAFQVANLYEKQSQFNDSIKTLETLETNHPKLTTTFKIKHKILRDIGKNYYYLDQYELSLSSFLKAFNLAQINEDVQAMAKSYNDLGIVYKAQSRYADSIEAYKQSLKLKESLNLTEEIGSTMNNIGNIYILINDFSPAYEFHQKALQHYLSLDQHNDLYSTRIIHIKNQIGTSLQKLGKLDEAIKYLEQSIDEAVNLTEKNLILFDTYCTLADFYLLKQQTTKASSLMKHIQGISNINTDQELSRLAVNSKIMTAKQEFQSAHDNAISGLNIANLAANNEQVTLFLGLLSEINKKMQRYELAHDYQSQFIASKENFLQQRYDTEIKYLQNEIDLQQQQKNLTLLQKNNQIQELQIKKQQLLVLSFILLGVFLIILILWLISHKSKEKKQLLAQVNYHRKKLLDLQTPKEKLQEFLSHITEPLICINQLRTITFANQQFQDAYNQKQNDLIGAGIENAIPELSATLAKITFNSEDIPDQQQLSHIDDNGKMIKIWINSLHALDHAIVLSFQEYNEDLDLPSSTHLYVENANKIALMVKRLNSLKTNDNTAQTNQLIQQLEEKLKPTNSEEHLSENYRTSLVDLMCSNLDIWRKITHGDRISLAEESSIWKVTIDDGRLRTRAMDRYLSLKTLPKSPRWRPVVKTSHYILSECKLTDPQRKSLNQLLEIFMENLRNKNL